jgi:hypothetical protein
MFCHKIRFQPSVVITDFVRHFGADEHCAESMRRARWFEGFRFSSCGGARHYLVSQYACKLFRRIWCRRPAAVTAGTIMEHFKLSLKTWFLRVYSG